MIVIEQKKRLSPIPCPLCGSLQDILVNGLEYRQKDGDDLLEVLPNRDKGYAFCNCRNIFYTEWNPDIIDVYDQPYSAKYNADNAKKFVARYSIYLEDMQRINNGKTLLEIGAASDAVLDEAKKLGITPTGLDIMRRKSEHRLIIANYELINLSAKFDMVFASHVWEHFKDPIRMAKKTLDLMNSGGLLFISMPDTYQIDWKDPYAWGHWHYKEHFIMWDMDSFCEMMEQVGFRTLKKHRNFTNQFICTADMHLLFQKP